MKKKECPKVPGWMTVFTDMTTLLLTFFILMFTIAEIDGNELKLILSSFTGSLGIREGGLTLEKGPLANMGMTIEKLPARKSLNNLSRAYEEAEVRFNVHVKDKKVRLSEEERGIVISIPGEVYFESGSAVLKEEGKELLDEVGRFLLMLRGDIGGLDTQVEIEGHASLEPDSVEDGGFNVSRIWERNLDLSINRAKNVEKFFIGGFLGFGVKPVLEREGRRMAKFVAKGYGEFQPLELNNTPEERAWNRRVDIVIKRN